MYSVTKEMLSSCKGMMRTVRVRSEPGAKFKEPAWWLRLASRDPKGAPEMSYWISRYTSTTVVASQSSMQANEILSRRDVRNYSLSFNLRLQLQKTQESNSDLILAVRDLEEILEQKNSEIANLSSRPESCGDAAGLKATISKGGTSEDEEQLELEDLVQEHNNAKKTHMLEK
ncbi:hypothetical protein EV1_000671 [Malus domestica]